MVRAQNLHFGAGGSQDFKAFFGQWNCGFQDF
jgi:hypothetical protein